MLRQTSGLEHDPVDSPLHGRYATMGGKNLQEIQLERTTVTVSIATVVAVEVEEVYVGKETTNLKRKEYDKYWNR